MSPRRTPNGAGTGLTIAPSLSVEVLD